MARPHKDNAEYFSHDADMRNDLRIKALRRKFKAEGFGIWCMLLEVITDCDFFKLRLDIEILAGDFDVEPEQLQAIIAYCVERDLFQTDGIFLWSNTLQKRFAGLLSKRERTRTVVMDVDNPQRKGKERKVKENDLTLWLNDFLKRKSTNTSELRSMVQQWKTAGLTDIQEQIQAMKAVYQTQKLVFPTRIETLTQSFMNSNWVEKLKDLNPERIAENIQQQKNGNRKHTVDEIGTSPAGSLE